MIGVEFVAGIEEDMLFFRWGSSQMIVLAPRPVVATSGTHTGRFGVGVSNEVEDAMSEK